MIAEKSKQGLSKSERLNSRMLIERLFSGKSRSLPAFPLRVVYMMVNEETLPVSSLMVSVSKKRFKRAVKRNHVKRQIREAYRKNKYLLTDVLQATEQKVLLAFIWIDNELHSSEEIEIKVKRLLQLIAERLS